MSPRGGFEISNRQIADSALPNNLDAHTDTHNLGPPPRIAKGYIFIYQVKNLSLCLADSNRQLIIN